MNRNIIETIMGAVVLTVAMGVLFFAYQNSSKRPVEGYALSARFESAAGVAPGTDVRIGGIKVGSVTDMQLDPKTYQAIVVMQVKSDTRIPDDSSAAIVSDGLLGSKFLAIEPGGSDAMLAENGVIQYTQPSVSFETLIGKFMFSGGGVDGGEKGVSNATAADDPLPAANAPDAAMPAIQ